VEYNKQTKNRLKRVEGQIRGILKMMEDNQDCERVINQLTAVSSAVSHTIGIIVSENLKNCILDQLDNEDFSEDLVKHAANLLVKSR
jgi:DNA-binding FrmR family transcriptional regulator